jgi:anaerobic selenocysteine-containing dehydrogenase
MPTTPETTRFRACPLCEAICGLEIRVDAAGLPVAIRGDAADLFSRGHICPKGNAILDLENDPDRLRRPLRRRGSTWEEISWETAFEEAGAGLAAVQRAHGADALGAYLGNPNVHHFGHFAYLPSLLRQFKTRNVFSASSVDQWPHQVVAWAMYGHQFLIPIADVDNTDYLLMLGANPVASNGSLMTAPGFEKRLKALVARGKLVVVDPRRTETAAIASEHLAILPGTDLWFLRALLGELQRLGPPRLGAYEDRLNGFTEAVAQLAVVGVEQAAARTGLAADDIRRIARELYAAPKAAVYGRMGLSTQEHGTLCQWLLQLLLVYLGQLDAVGGSLPNDPAMPVTGPGTSPGYRGKTNSRVRGLPGFSGEIPVAAMAEEMTTPGEGQVRGLLSCAGNPVLSTPDGRAVDAALAGLECFVAIDIYLNESTRHAHYILPPAPFLTQYHYDMVFNGFAVRRVAKLSQRPRRCICRGRWQSVAPVAAAEGADRHGAGARPGQADGGSAGSGTARTRPRAIGTFPAAPAGNRKRRHRMRPCFLDGGVGTSRCRRCDGQQFVRPRRSRRPAAHRQAPCAQQ